MKSLNGFMKSYPLKQWLIDQIKFHESNDKCANIHCVPYYKECLGLLSKREEK